MPSNAARPEGRQLIVFPAHHLANAHTFFVYAAFLVALVVGCWLHFDKITRNEWFGYPQEWVPSVSATIGDRYPERALFQILICICAGPRLAMIALWYLLTRRANSKLPVLVTAAGMIRCCSAVGWMMITSSDDHDAHDIAMFVFLFATPLWMGGSIALSPRSLIHGDRSRKWRKITAAGFFGSIPPMIYLFVQHKVYQVPGAYSRYAYFEWNLILTDIGFDAVNALDFTRLEIRIFDMGASTAEAKTQVAPPPRLDVKSPAVDALDHVHWRDCLAFLSDSILGYCFFTTMTALGPCIFFFNVYNMGMAGQEALLLVNMSVLFLVYRPLRRFIAAYPALFQLLALGGLAGYPDDYESHRLGYIAASNAVQMLVYASLWLGDQSRPAKLHRDGITLGVGLIGTVIAKLANHSLNPAWPFVDKRSGGYNGTILAFGIAACLEKSLRPRAAEPPAPPTSATGSTARSAIGFGSLLFALHHLLSDGGSIIARTWTGYPLRGPTSLPYASFTVAAMAAGLATPYSPYLWLVAALGSYILHAFDHWFGFAGGLVLAFALMSALPPFLRAVSTRPRPALAFAVAFFTYDLLVLADVWTVAYAFVPGGKYLRERTDLVQVAMLLCLALGAYDVSSFASFPRIRQTPALKAMTRTALAALVLLAGLACGWRLQRAAVPVPFLPYERIMTAGIWTVHFGLDGFMWESQRRMRDLLRDAQLDVVGLLESDLQRIVFGNRDMTQYISEDLGYYADIGPGPHKHTWGAALLSKFPILNSTHHLLPSPHGELAPAIHATLDVYGTMVDVVVAHNGQEEDPLDRQMQSAELGRIMAEAHPRPLIFLGYVVTKPHAARPSPYPYLIDDGKMLDVDPADQDRWCEYILFRGLRRVAYARITRGSNPSVTDTELQTARFVVPTTPLDPSTDITGGRHVSPSEVPAAWLYSHQFFGHGVRGHRYHVLGNGNQANYFCEEGCSVV